MNNKVLKEFVAGLILSGLLTLASGIILLISSTLNVSVKEDAYMRVKKGPPCVIEAFADGELVSRVKGPNACKIKGINI